MRVFHHRTSRAQRHSQLSLPRLFNRYAYDAVPALMRGESQTKSVNMKKQQSNSSEASQAGPVPVPRRDSETPSSELLRPPPPTFPQPPQAYAPQVYNVQPWMAQYNWQFFHQNLHAYYGQIPPPFGMAGNFGWPPQDPQPRATQDVTVQPDQSNVIHAGNRVPADGVLPGSSTGSKEKKSKDKKIMLPAPMPTGEYIEEAMEEPFVIDPPDRVLVILDLNGTLIYRPQARKKPQHMIARPYLKPFLQYLFENFAVMVWSSAKPENVEVLVDNVLDEELQGMLVSCWARNTFGLTPNQYSMNVQVYKDLTRVWASDNIQKHMPGYTFGKRFGQDNTILIDDSALKANAQPHNLLEIPEFTATDEQMKSDILKEVAGYLQTARMQNNVSSFMRERPFKADGFWAYDWPEELAGGGEINEQAHLHQN